MDQIVKQIGNAVVILNKDTGEILEIIGLNFFSFQFYQGTIQLIDSSTAKDVRTIQLANLYDEGLNNLNTEALALSVVSTFSKYN